MAHAIDIVLDLREADRQPGSADEFLSLWGELEGRLHGASLQGSASWQVSTPTWGTCGLLLTDLASAPSRVTEETPFTVRSVLEPSRVIYKCATCLAAGREEYGPFTCGSCKADGDGRAADAQDRVCARHAVLLDGSFRSTCPRHAPRCVTCKASATFWCHGRDCRAEKSYCDRHRRFHPGDQSVSYCLDCYAAKFPECGHRGCTATGLLVCDFISQGTLTRCGVRACTKHAFRWQVFGPHRRGPVLCSSHEHARSRLSREELAFQIVATACAVGSRQAGRSDGTRQPEAPRLQALSIIRHIFINSRDEALPIDFLDRLLRQLQRGLGGTGLAGTMRRSLELQEGARREEVSREEIAKREGMAYFARLQQILARDGKHELASAVAYSDFRQKARILRVRVPEHVVGQFYGRQGSTIKSLSQELGITVKREEK